MKIVICASIDFSLKIKKVKEDLEREGHKVSIPYYTTKIISGEVNLIEYKKIKEEKGDLEFREKSEVDLFKRHFNNIKDFDAILVLNYDKKGISGYIGGNTFLEMGFAYVLDKRIFVLNNLPEMNYLDELKAMKPIVLNGDLLRIK